MSTETVSIEQLVSQLVLAAIWENPDSPASPATAVARVLGMDDDDPRLRLIKAQVSGQVDLTWEEQVGLAFHLMLDQAAHPQHLAA